MNSDDVTLLNYKHCHTCGAKMYIEDGGDSDAAD